MYFAVSPDPKGKIKEREKIDKYLFASLKKTVTYWIDGDTNWRTEETGYRRKNRDDSDHSNVKIS